MLIAKRMKKDNRGVSGGLVTSLIFGVAALVIGVIIAFIITQTLSTANLLGTNTLESNATSKLRGNFTTGVDNVSGKIPTVLLIAAVVLIISVLAVLVLVWQKMRLGGGSTI